METVSLSVNIIVLSQVAVLYFFVFITAKPSMAAVSKIPKLLTTTVQPAPRLMKSVGPVNQGIYIQNSRSKEPKRTYRLNGSVSIVNLRLLIINFSIFFESRILMREKMKLFHLNEIAGR